MFQKLIAGFAILFAVAIAGFAVYVASRQHLRFDAPYPPIQASTDSAVVERGRYLVRNLAVCAGCHGDAGQVAAFDRGEDVPLSGGYMFAIPPGRFYAHNITPDPETGLGRVSDAAIARALRFGVGHDGRALLPFMAKQGLTDDDLVAVVSYLRTQAPVHNVVPDHDYNLLGKIVKATLLANPVGPSRPPEPSSPRGATVENGRYLVESVIDCGGCHTQRDERTGAMVGPTLGGATGMVGVSPDGTWSPPNITAGGKLAGYDEDAFVVRFHAGSAVPGSPMPWVQFSSLADDDLRAVYRYLKTLPVVARDVGPAFVRKAK